VDSSVSFWPSASLERLFQSRLMATVSIDESILIRQCSPLYASFALESLSNFLLGCTFCYLVLLIASKNQLENPGCAALKWATEHMSWAFNDWYQMMKTWTRMPELPLDQRMAFCRKLNLGICITQVMASFLAITRWLHFGNINGFRYLGYSVTCSLMQAELVILIAPYMPWFKTNVIGVMLITFSTMIVGWAGSLQPGELYEYDSIESFSQSWDFSDIVLTDKGYRILPSWILLAVLVFVQIPMLGLIFACKSGLKAHRDLPYHYLRLLLLVALTWPCFGIWWFLSSEGEGLIHDTKANTFGFCSLNMISKGGFTLMMLKLSRDHRSMWIDDCVVTPKAQNEDLWIVKQLRPYDPSSAGYHEKKFTEADLDAAVARALARHGMNAPSQFGANPFGLPDSHHPSESHAAVQEMDAPETLEATTPKNSSILKRASSEASIRAFKHVNFDSEAPVLPTLIHSSHPQPQGIPQTVAPAQVSGQEWWPCSCDKKPAVNVQTVEEPRV